MASASILLVILFVVIAVGVIAVNLIRRQRNDDGQFHAGMGDGSYYHHHTEHGQGSTSHDQGGTASDHGGHWGSHDTGDAGGGGDWGGGDGGGGDGGGGGE